MKFYKLASLLGGVALLLATFSLYKSFSSSTLVYVDVNKLIEGYQRTKTVKAEFNKKATVMRANVDSLLNGWQSELKKYEKDRVSYSPKELQLQQELLATKQQQITNYQQAIEKQVMEEDKKVTQTVINDINDYIKEYGQNHGYKIIFGASGGGNIMYADESTDLTEDVLKGLNSEYVKK